MEIIETPLFESKLERFFSDEEYRELQNHLVARPSAGAVLRGSGGLRKVRWASGGKGKSGGARVIYYLKTTERLYMLFVYGKGEQADLTPQQLKYLRRLLD